MLWNLSTIPDLPAVFSSLLSLPLLPHWRPPLDRAHWLAPSRQVGASSDSPPDVWTLPSPSPPAAASYWRGRNVTASPTPHQSWSICSQDRMYGWRLRSHGRRGRWNCCPPGRCCMTCSGTCFRRACCASRWWCWDRCCCWRRRWHSLSLWNPSWRNGDSGCLLQEPSPPLKSEVAADPKAGAILCSSAEPSGSDAPSWGERRRAQQTCPYQTCLWCHIATVVL